MKAMFVSFLAAAVIGIGAGTLLNASYQATAGDRFTTSGVQLRQGEAGANLVGADWSGVGKPKP